MPLPCAVITGWGFYVPARVLSNADLEKMVGTTDAWIVERTGIRERRIVSDDESTCSMATTASERALARAHIAASDLDTIIVATTTPDHLLPPAAAVIQDRLGARGAAVFDVGAACAGWIYGLAIARGLIAAGTARRILLVGAETISRYVDWSDRATCVLFGDGAGAVVVEASADGGGVLSTVLRGDGSKRELLTVLGGGSKYPPSERTLREGMHYIRMQGSEVFKAAVPSMAEAVEDALAQAGLALADVDLLVPHQANARIVEAVAKRLRLDPAKVFLNIERYGNTSAASIPIALCEAVDTGRVHPGDHLAFVAFGGGMTWGAAVVEWTAPVTMT